MEDAVEKFPCGTSPVLEIDYENYVGYLDPKKDKSPLMTPRGFGGNANGWGFRGANIFLEIYRSTNSQIELPPLYTMMDREVNDLPSAHQIFIHSADEYEAAMKLVGSWKHWKQLTTNSKLFVNGGEKWDGLDVWREELEIRRKSKARRALMNLVSQNDRGAAGKILDEGKTNPRGRPTKSDIKKEARIEAGRQKKIEEDFKRIHYSPAH